MVNCLKFSIGDLIAYKNDAHFNYLFGKDYGVVTGITLGHDHQTWYKIKWAHESRTRLSAYSFTQLELVAPVGGSGL